MALATGFFNLLTLHTQIPKQVTFGRIAPRDSTHQSSRWQMSEFSKCPVLMSFTTSHFPCLGSDRFYAVMPSTYSPLRKGIALAMHQPQMPLLSDIAVHLSSSFGNVSGYPDDADLAIKSLASRWGLKSKASKCFDHYKAVSLNMCKHIYPSSTSVERITAVILFQALLFTLDDLCFDHSRPFNVDVVALEEFGMDISMWQDSSKMKTFWANLMDLFKGSKSPDENIAMEQIWWESSRLLQSISPQMTWFHMFTECVEEYVHSSIGLYERNELYMCGDLSSDLGEHNALYKHVDLLFKNSGMKHTIALIELTNEAYLSDEARDDPNIQKLFFLAARYARLANDLVSYHKEKIEDRPLCNIVQVLMDHQSESLEQAARRVIDMAISDSLEFLEIERKLPSSLSTSRDENVTWFVQGLKEMMVGAYFWQMNSNRYRSVDSPFPELRPLSSEF